MTLGLIPYAHKEVLREDVVVQGIVNVDRWGNTKVYEEVADTDVKAPFVVVSQIPTSGDLGVYGDDYALQVTEFQVSSWGRDDAEAWLLADACDDALLYSVWEITPYTLMKVRRNSTPVVLPDRDTNLRQVQVRYRAMFGR